VITFAIALAGNFTTERVAKPGSWLADVISGLVLLSAMCGTYYLCCVLDRRDQHGGDSSDGDDGGGGTHRAGGPTPPQDSPDTDPEWWPEFEQQFAHHVGRRIDAGSGNEYSRPAAST
jgi:hypothetical protein